MDVFLACAAFLFVVVASIRGTSDDTPTTTTP
jgi:hypothetical protein